MLEDETADEFAERLSGEEWDIELDWLTFVGILFANSNAAFATTDEEWAVMLENMNRHVMSEYFNSIEGEVTPQSVGESTVTMDPILVYTTMGNLGIAELNISELNEEGLGYTNPYPISTVREKFLAELPNELQQLSERATQELISTNAIMALEGKSMEELAEEFFGDE